ncbi:MAG TPA: twin-arginine translocase TatA/TatE family subunit [Actinomycetota bacterium]|nr:twin-arginine translocase TatA/TatE family subunit [Actinomycetota bacterium]
MFNISPQELLLILVIALVVVGPKRLPSLGRSIGRGLRELRKAQDDVKRTIEVNLDEEPPNGSAGDPAGEGPATSDPAPSAREPLPPSKVAEVSRTLGRGLREIRKARQEVERSFRVDLTEPTTPPPPATSPLEDAPDRPAGA